MRQVRELKNIEIPKSYPLPVWSEWDTSRYPDFPTISMRECIHEDFSGIEASILDNQLLIRDRG